MKLASGADTDQQALQDVYCLLSVCKAMWGTRAWGIAAMLQERSVAATLWHHQASKLLSSAGWTAKP